MREVSGAARILDDIKNSLRESGQFIGDITFDYAEDADQAHEDAETLRALGRRAGRELRWKISTHATYRRPGIRVVVILKESNPVHQAMLRREGEEQLIKAINEISKELGL